MAGNNRIWYEIMQRFNRDFNRLQSRIKEVSKKDLPNSRILEMSEWDSEITEPKKWELNVLAKVFNVNAGKILEWMNTFA